MRQATRFAKQAGSLTGLPQVAKMMGSAFYNSAMQMTRHRKSGEGAIGSVAKGGMQGAVDLAKASSTSFQDHVKQSFQKGIGGQGVAASHQHITGVAERLFDQAESARLQAKHANLHPAAGEVYASTDQEEKSESESREELPA